MGEVKVLIFSEPFGCGHEKAAEALAAGFQGICKDVKVKSLHALSYFQPLISKMVQHTYRGFLMAMPFMWSGLYERSKRSGGNSEYLLLKLYRKKMIELIEEENPDIIVCTHPFPAAVIGALKTEKMHSIPLAGVVTDFDVHTSWRCPGVDLYLVQNQEAAELLVGMGIPREKVLALGIPVHPHFVSVGPGNEAKEKLGLNPELPLVSVSGGGWGLGPIEEIVRELVNLEEQIQLLVICGSNKGMEKRLKRMAAGHGNLKVAGYANNVHEIMQGTDLLVAKPGGLTSCEALTTGVPMVLFEAFGGQENHNAAYLTDVGAAAKPQRKHIAQTVAKLLSEKRVLAEMARAALAHARPTSAVDGAKSIMLMAAK